MDIDPVDAFETMFWGWKLFGMFAGGILLIVGLALCFCKNWKRGGESEAVFQIEL